MRVQGQGMALEYYPAKNERNFSEEEKKAFKEEKKIGLKDLKFEQQPIPETLHEAVETANEALKIANYHLQFRLHEESGRYQVKVIDSNTNKVIREIPPENILEFSATIKKMLNEAVGVLVDEMA